MRNLVLSLSVLLSLTACSNKDTYIIDGTVAGVADGKKVFLEQINDTLGIVTIDTAIIKGEKFILEGKILEPGMHTLTVEGVNAPSYLIVEPGTINLTIYKDSTYANRYSGTFNTDRMAKYSTEAMKVQRKLIAFEKKNRSVYDEAVRKKDTATMNRMHEAYTKLQEELKTTTIQFVEKNPDAYISAFLVKSMFNSPAPDVAAIQKYYDNFTPEIKKTVLGHWILRKLNQFKSVSPGRTAPDFTAPGPDGNPVSLHKSLGKLTILDFWASWCGPCRAENPNLVALYKEFHDRGLNIVSVSLDQPGDDKRWKEAIAKDGLTWTHVSNLKYWDDPIAKLYGVEAIPKMFLLNEVGVVVAKDLRGDELKKKVAEFIGPRK